MSFYKLYIKINEVYQEPEIYPSMKKLQQRLAGLNQEYLIIKRENNTDHIIEHKQIPITFVDDLKSNVKVKARVFTLDDKEKQKKRKLRKEEKRKLQKEIDKWIDR